MRIKLTKQAEIDLERAIEYIEVELDNEIASANFEREARKKFALIADFPELFAIIDDEILAEKGFRKFLINNYLAFYIIREESNSVTVERILHSSCNWLSIMQNEAVKL